MVLKDIFLSEIPWGIGNVQIWINAVISESVEFLQDNIIILFDHHLA